MATTTTNYSLNKPTPGGDTDTWGDLLNTSMDLIDTQMKANADAVAGLGDPVTVAHGGTGATTAGDARGALGLGTAATQSDSKYSHRANNLNDLNNKSAALANLGGAPIPAGTKMLFQQSAAPTGWTKDTTHNNKALRVVTGTAGSGGGNGFTTAFNSVRSSNYAGSHNHTITVTVGNTTLTTNQIPAHAHWEGSGSTSLSGFGTTTSKAASVSRPDGGVTSSSGVWLTETTGGGAAHNHPGSGSSGTAGSHTHSLNLNVQYVDLIIATRD